MTWKLLIEANRKWLTIYYVVAQIIGWFLILSAIGCLVYFLSSAGTRGAAPPIYPLPILLLLQRPFLEILLPGLLALLSAQLLRYLLDKKPRPSWLLRHSDMLLYLTSLILFVSFIPGVLLAFKTLLFQPYNFVEASPLDFIGMFTIGFIGLAKLMVTIGIGYALRRLLPIIEESKALV